jgi:ATP-dependent RNA circularization protein (DNA/RNA ligase family)
MQEKAEKQEKAVSPMFFKFPHTPHLLWLEKSPCREDKVFSDEEARAFLDGKVTVEEKVDGANIGFSLDESGVLRVQSRGNYLSRGSHPQFQPLWPWIETRRLALIEALQPGLMLFGEWCFARHSVPYKRLPDWFLGFDVYDRTANCFWSSDRRNGLLKDLGLASVPRLSRGSFSTEQLLSLIGKSRLSASSMEGIYLRREQGDWLEHRAKVVRREFVEGIGAHWSEDPLEKNVLAQS